MVTKNLKTKGLWLSVERTQYRGLLEPSQLHARVKEAVGQALGLTPQFANSTSIPTTFNHESENQYAD